MTNLKNDLLLRALLRLPVERTPVWMMRQAGRYLPEYRQTRAKAGSFMKLCCTPELACEVTLQPLRRYAFDAAILFSDILTVPDAMGLGLYFVEGEGPKFSYPVRDAQAIKKLAIPDPESDLRYVTDAIRLIVGELNGQVPLIGFSGSPWTIATYMVEGGSSKEFANIKSLLFDEPELLHQLLDKNAQAITEYLKAQIAAGVQIVMIFDTWGGVLAPDKYREFSLPYMQQIIQALPHEVNGQVIPKILFTKGAGPLLADMALSGCDALGVDWMTSLTDARTYVQDKVALQGNLDPSVLYARPEIIKQEVSKVLADYGNGPGHVFNLGHGIHPGIDPEHVAAMVEAVHELSPQHHNH
ncbi:MAG: uroporphyrinogen decarboxylase [Gammaproteobacteria bacterium]|nr:uroporphyrinogen decarboxylase [Gammaproteobacteria bacterium]